MLTSVFLFVVVLFVILPFVPGYIELQCKKDAEPLFIDTEKNVSPLATGDKFKNWIDVILKSPDIAKFPVPGSDSVHLIENNTILATVFVGNMTCPDKSVFTSRIMANGSADIGDFSKLPSLYSNSNVTIGKGSVIENWIDGRGNFMISSDNTNLGHCCVCTGELKLGKGNRFERLYGIPICTSGETDPYTIAYTEKEGDVISLKKVTVGKHEKWSGSISSRKDVVIDDESFVCGSVFSDGNILIGKNCIILGNVFSQGDVYIGSNTIIGKEGHIKSVVANGKLVLESKVRVHGHVLCVEGLTK